MKINYNQSAFSQLLRSAIGNRKKKDFASIIGISPEYLSRLLNGKAPNTPSIELLKNIARNAQNSISYSQLLQVCGYTGRNESPANPPISASESHKFMKATILTALESLSMPWTLEPSGVSCDLSIRVSSEMEHCWYFRFLPMEEDQLQQHLSENYLALLFQSIKNEDKYSLVTSSKAEYDLFLEQLPVNLNLNLSIILVDMEHLEIQEESWLSTATRVNSSLEQIQL